MWDKTLLFSEKVEVFQDSKREEAISWLTFMQNMQYYRTYVKFIKITEL